MADSANLCWPAPLKALVSNSDPGNVGKVHPQARQVQCLNLLLCRYIVGTATDVSDLAMPTTHPGWICIQTRRAECSKKIIFTACWCQHSNLGI